MNSKVVLGSRILLAIIFLVFGTNGLIMIITGAGLIPMPPPTPEMGVVMAGFFGMKYLMPLVKLMQIVAALLLLSGRYMNLAITLLTPIVVNILGVHLFVDRSGAPMAIFITVLLLILIKHRWQYFKSALVP